MQTAYANGAATAAAVAALGRDCVALTATGVKHLHARATGFDAGVYFEANGHGAVLLSGRLLGAADAAAGSADAAAAAAGLRVAALANACNQAVGDALSGVLLVDAALRGLGWGWEAWAGLYADLPSRMARRGRDRGVSPGVAAQSSWWRTGGAPGPRAPRPTSPPRPTTPPGGGARARPGRLHHHPRRDGGHVPARPAGRRGRGRGRAARRAGVCAAVGHGGRRARVR